MIKKILIAEDEVNVGKYWKMTLNSRGYDVHTCVTGIDAQDEIRKWKPNLVILDLSMPTTGREEGFYVLEYIRRNNENISVIIATGMFSIDEVEERVSKMNCENLVKKIMIKDFSNEELLQQVENIISP